MSYLVEAFATRTVDPHYLETNDKSLLLDENGYKKVSVDELQIVVGSSR